MYVGIVYVTNIYIYIIYIYLYFIVLYYIILFIHQKLQLQPASFRASFLMLQAIWSTAEEPPVYWPQPVSAAENPRKSGSNYALIYRCTVHLHNIHILYIILIYKNRSLSLSSSPSHINIMYINNYSTFTLSLCFSRLARLHVRLP